MPLNPTLRKQSKQELYDFKGRLVCKNKFEDRQDLYTEKSCLK